MRQISSEPDFQQYRAAGRGYIYNTLRVALCRTLRRANTKIEWQR